MSRRVEENVMIQYARVHSLRRAYISLVIEKSPTVMRARMLHDAKCVSAISNGRSIVVGMGPIVFRSCHRQCLGVVV